MKKHRTCFLILLVACFLTSCSVRSRRFDSAGWRMGDPSTRGAMVQDLIESSQLLGKSPSEVEGFLGKPDYQSADWYGYKVITIGRCRFWQCRMDVTFDPSIKGVKGVSVVD